MVEFEIIDEEAIVYPGEYILHVPTKQIVLCGAFKKTEGKIRVMVNGRLIEDSVENFQKIKLSGQERKLKNSKVRSCGGCKR